MKIKKKYIFCTLILMIGLLTISFIASADSYSSYENRCLDWGNKYSYTALRDVTFSYAGMNFGQIFRCNKTVGINVIGINIQACSVWSPNVLSYSIRNVSSTTGYPTNYINTSKNNFIPVAGWNKLTFAEKIILTEGNYYSLEFRDYNGVFSRTMYVTIRLGDDGRSNIFGRSPSGAYEPMDRSYRRTSFSSPCYTDGSMPWYISHYYGVNLYRNNSGNIYSGFFANSVFGGTMIRQTFKPTENMYVKSITANVIPYEVLDYIPNDNLTVCLFNESSGLYLVNATLINKKEPCLIPYDSAIYTVYRPYTVELNANKYLSSSYVYSIRFRSWGSDANSGYIVQTMISTVEVYFKPLTFQGLTRNTSYTFNNGSWIYNSNLTDIVFTLNQVNSSWIAVTTTPFTYHNNTVNVSSVKQLKLLSDGYHLWDNSSSGVMSYTTFVNCTGTLQKAWYSALGKFKVWANVTGTTTPFTYHNNTVNVSSVKQLKLLSNGYHLWDNSSSGVMSYTNFLNCSGTLQKAWYPALGKFKVWANVTGTTTPITLYDDTPPGIMNIHEYGLYSTGYKVWSNVSVSISYCDNPIIDSITENLINCTGGIDSIYDRTIGWTLFANYTGNTTPITLHQSPVHATGTHVYGLNTSGYQVFANYTGDTPSITQYQNIVNATGTHQNVWSPSLWRFFDWANYTGNGTTVNLHETIVNATGTHVKVDRGSGVIDVYANYTGNTTSCGNTSLNVIENLVNVSGGYYSVYNSLTGWTVQNNYTGLNALNFIEHLINASGGHQQYWNGTSWSIYNNYTGNTTPLHQVSVIVNATGTHSYTLNGTGYWDTASYTGNTTTIHTNDVMVNCTGSLSYLLNLTGYWVTANHVGVTTPIGVSDTKKNVTGSTTYILDSSGYHVSSTHESIVNLFENLINVTGTHQKQWTGLFWKVYANYSGNGSAPTPIHLYQNFLNSTGTHEYVLNGSGYQVWANVTGNNSAFVNVTRLLPIGSGSSSSLIMMGMVFGSSGLMLFGMRRRRKRNQ